MAEPRGHFKSEQIFQGVDEAFWINFPLLRHDMPGSHDHDFAEIVLIVEGQGTHVSIYGETPLRRGDCVIVLPGAWHTYRVPERLEVANCCFAPRLLHRELGALQGDAALEALFLAAMWEAPQLPNSTPLVLHLNSPLLEQALECIHGLHRCQQDVLPAARLERRGYFLLLLGILSRSLSPEMRRAWEQAATWPAPVRRCVALLESDLAWAWTLTGLAKEVHLEPSYLGRMFRLHVGQPPFEYLNRRRLEQAATLLLSTRLSISEIALACGLESPTYFARRFRTHFGCSAGQFRKNKRGGQL